MSEDSSNKNPRMAVLSVRKISDDKDHWNEIGSAFDNGDTITVYADAIPAPDPKTGQFKLIIQKKPRARREEGVEQEEAVS